MATWWSEGRKGGWVPEDSPCFSWIWPLPLTCAILLLSMGPGGSGIDSLVLQEVLSFIKAYYSGPTGASA